MVQTHKHSYYSEKHTHFGTAHSDAMHTLHHCVNICEACSQMCIEEGHKIAAALCRDCADICILFGRLENRHSQFAHKLHDVCREVCQKCAEECEKINKAPCLECAEVCRACQKESFEQ